MGAWKAVWPGPFPEGTAAPSLHRLLRILRGSCWKAAKRLSISIPLFYRWGNRSLREIKTHPRSYSGAKALVFEFCWASPTPSPCFGLCNSPREPEDPSGSQTILKTQKPQSFFFLRRGFATKDVSIFIQPEEKKKKKPRRNHWHIAGKGLIALIYKELLPINKREAFIKKTMDKR